MARSKQLKAWHEHFVHTMDDLGAAAARAMLLGLDEAAFLEVAKTCYGYWQRLRENPPPYKEGDGE